MFLEISIDVDICYIKGSTEKFMVESRHWPPRPRLTGHFSAITLAHCTAGLVYENICNPFTIGLIDSLL